MTVVFGSPGSGAGQTSLQRAYDNSGGIDPMIQLALADGTLTIRDDATPLADMFALQNNAGVAFLTADAAIFDYGIRTNRGYEFQLDPTGREGINFLPDGRTQTTTAVQSSCIQWDSLVIADIPGGAPFGNDTAPAMIASIGECRFDDPGNLFSSSLLFNQASILTANGVNVGPVYTMVNQPLLRTGTLGGARTFSQANAVRSQLRVGPNLAGSVTLTSHEPFFVTASIDAAVGSASITTLNYFAPKAPNLLNGGTVGTLNVMDIPNIPGAGITTLRGINSAMSSGDFIRHTGTAPVEILGGGIHLGDSIPVQFGGAALNSQDASVFWSGGNALSIFFALNSDTLELTNPAADNIRIDAAGDASLNVNTVEVAFGSGLTADGNNNWQFANSPPARTLTVGGTDAARRLFSAGGALTLNAAFTNAFTDIVNEPFLAGSTAPTNAGNMLIQTSVGFGTNRYGLLITANPSGGTINRALRVVNGQAQFDQEVDFQTNDATAAGGAATLGQIGGSGPTATAQATWLRVEIGGVTHWLPAWT